MDEDNPEISPALGKLPRPRLDHHPSITMKRYKDNNELPYRWKYIDSFNTPHERYRFGNDITIKAKPTTRRKKRTPIYIH